jgi:hypothetical protein
MATTFTKAVRLASAFARADFGNAAVLQDGSGFSYIIGYRAPSGASVGNLLSKNADNAANGGYALPLIPTGSDFYIDAPFSRSTTRSVFRVNPIVAEATWAWMAVTLDRSSFAVKIYAASYGASLTDQSASDINGGSGTSGSDATWTLKLGSNASSQGPLNPMECFFLGRWNSVLSLSTINSYCSDMEANGKASSVLYVKPTAADTGSLPDLSGQGNNGTYSGTTSIVDGPDPASTPFRPYFITG